MTLLAEGPHFHLESDADLAELWTQLMGPGGFAQRTLWLIFVDHQHWTLPVIMPNEDITARPAARDLEALGRLIELAREQADVESFAVLLSRPGSHHKTVDDRAWAAAVARTAKERGIPMWPVHLATYERVQVMAPDDLVGA